MYSGVAEPASPASTSAASPGASAGSRKLSRTIVRRRDGQHQPPPDVGASRLALTQSGLLRGPGRSKDAVQAERTHDRSLSRLLYTVMK